MLTNHITEADYQKLLKAKENAGKVKEKVGYNKNPIKLPGNFLEGIDNARRYSNAHASTIGNPASHSQMPFLGRSDVRKSFVAIILLLMVLLLINQIIKQKKTA